MKLFRKKYHWYSVSFTDGKETTQSFRGLPSKNVNTYTIRALKESLQCPHEWVLSSLIYLGKMAEADFYGPEDIDPNPNPRDDAS